MRLDATSRGEGGGRAWSLISRTLFQPACLVALVFAASALGKLIRPNPTLAVLQLVWNLDVTSSRAVWGGLIAAEVALAVGLVWPRTRSVAIWAGCVLLASVSVSIVRQLAEGSLLPCGCGLMSGRLPTRAAQWASLGTNALLFAMLLIGSPSERRATAPTLVREAPCPSH